MFDKRQRGIQEAMGRVGMNNQRENPYSPFGGNVPQQTLQELSDYQMQRPEPMQRDGRYPRPPQQPPQALPQIGIPQAPPPNMAPQLPPQMAPMPQRNPRIAQLLQNPRFLEMMRRRRGGMR